MRPIGVERRGIMESACGKEQPSVRTMDQAMAGLGCDPKVGAQRLPRVAGANHDDKSNGVAPAASARVLCATPRALDGKVLDCF
jgi:hypothetical protein